MPTVFPYLVIAGLVLAANLPFFSSRFLVLGPCLPTRALACRLFEVMMLGAVVVVLAMWAESRIGQRHEQGWEFFAVMVALLLTLAFPGFVWRCLRRSKQDRRVV